MTKNTKSGSRTTATSSVDLWGVLVGKVGNLGETWVKINHHCNDQNPIAILFNSFGLLCFLTRSRAKS